MGEPKTVFCAAIKQGTVNIYNLDTNNNAAIKPLLCVCEQGCRILIIYEIPTMVKKLFEEKCKHNRENYEDNKKKKEEGSREL